MAVKISPVLNGQQFSDSGILLVGGKIETYLAGSTTLATTFTSILENVAQTNPIILNTRGEVANPIYLTTGVKYKFVLKDSLNNVLRTVDNIEGVNDTSAGFDQWVNSSVAPVFINTTQFTLVGDQTNTFQVNRRVKLLVTSGTLYGFISASVFGTLTTVTVVLDSGVLDSGLSSVQIGLITSVNTSVRVTQNMLANNVASTGPAFRAFASVNQAVTSNVNTLVVLGTEVFDTNNNFATNRFTPTVAGYYQFSGLIRVSGTTISVASVSLYKNGVEDRRGTELGSSAQINTQIEVNGLIFCNGTTDFVELYGVIVATTPAFISSTSAATSHFSGFLARAL